MTGGSPNIETILRRYSVRLAVYVIFVGKLMRMLVP